MADKELLQENVQQSFELAVYHFFRDLSSTNKHDLDIYSLKLEEQMRAFKDNGGGQCHIQLQQDNVRVKMNSIFLEQTFFIDDNELDSFTAHREAARSSDAPGPYMYMKLPLSNDVLQKYVVYNTSTSLLQRVFGFLRIVRYQVLHCKFDTNVKLSSKEIAAKEVE